MMTLDDKIQYMPQMMTGWQDTKYVTGESGWQDTIYVRWWLWMTRYNVTDDDSGWQDTIYGTDDDSGWQDTIYVTDDDSGWLEYYKNGKQGTKLIWTSSGKWNAFCFDQICNKKKF